MAHKPSYQLTTHAVGSLREVWSVSWPLMLSFCSNSLMFFSDRLYLAHYSIEAMNAMAVAANFCYLLLIFPFAICEITEVFVGRFHGEERFKEVGRPTWQIIWLSIALWPLFSLGSRLLSSLRFEKDALSAIYLNTFSDFSPCLLVSIALTGFFVGIGRTRTITWATILANLVNIALAPILIFGTKFTPSLGIKGAAMATGISQGFQALLLFSIFLRKSFQERFNTRACKINPSLIYEMMQIGLPAGISRSIEVLAHCSFFWIMSMAGSFELTVVTFVQGFFLLVVFCNDGLSKGVTAVISNLVGAKEHGLIARVLKASFKVQAIIFSLVTIFCFVAFDFILSAVIQPQERALLNNPAFLFSMRSCLLLMCLFFLFDGFWWIVVGHLTAIGDTKFIMYMNATFQWLIYVIPTYLLVNYANLGAVGGWGMLALNAAILFTVFWLRSQKQLQRSLVPQRT